MAFTGTPTVTKISDNLFRITGVSLAGDASGTIGLSQDATPSEVALVAPGWGPRGDLDLTELVEIRISLATDVTSAVPISIAKAGGTPQTFQATLHNDSAATASAELEIWVEYH